MTSTPEEITVELGVQLTAENCICIPQSVLRRQLQGHAHLETVKRSLLA
jgi:hypothetical protein